MADKKRANSGADYEVGYGRPPKRTRFVKGHSGNPDGRPQGSRSIKSLLLAALNEKVTVNENGCTRQISKREAGAKHMANKVAQGDPRIFKMAVELLAGVEDRDEEQTAAHDKNTARERVTRKIEELSKKITARMNQQREPDEGGGFA